MMQREGRTWVLYSSKGRVLGRAPNRRRLLKRERQARFWANLAKSKGGKGSLLAKVQAWRGKRNLALRKAVAKRSRMLRRRRA